jgi:hypothetical protein
MPGKRRICRNKREKELKLKKKRTKKEEENS